MFFKNWSKTVFDLRNKIKHKSFRGICYHKNSNLHLSIVKPTRCINVSNLFQWSNTLHISNGLSVHYQELKTVHTAPGIYQTDTADCLRSPLKVISDLHPYQLLVGWFYICLVLWLTWFFSSSSSKGHFATQIQLQIRLRIEAKYEFQDCPEQKNFLVCIKRSACEVLRHTLFCLPGM